MGQTAPRRVTVRLPRFASRRAGYRRTPRRAPRCARPPSLPAPLLGSAWGIGWGVASGGWTARDRVFRPTAAEMLAAGPADGEVAPKLWPAMARAIAPTIVWRRMVLSLSISLSLNRCPLGLSHFCIKCAFGCVSALAAGVSGVSLARLRDDLGINARLGA